MSAGEIVPGLASPEEFKRLGIDRPYFFSDLKFVAVQRPNGQQVIRVTSSKAVRELYMNLLVEVLWPSGRLMREYTLLLDPPVYSTEPAVQAAPQLPVTAPARRSSASSSTSAANRPVGTPSAKAARSGTGEYRTVPRDRLWDIAERSPHGGTVQQTMLAILDLNPDAFIDGNINRMKSGQLLRLPTAEQVASRSSSQAMAEVSQQRIAWRNSPGGVTNARQLDATPRPVDQSVSAEKVPTDNLSLVAADAGTSTAGSEKGVDKDLIASQNQLVSLKESLDSSTRENTELKDRLSELQSQQDKLQRLIQLKDDQLARLQEQLASGGASTATTAAESSQFTPQDAPPVVSAIPPAVAAQPDPNQAEGGALQPLAAPVEAATPVPTPVQPLKPSATEDYSQDEGFLDSLLSNPVMVGATGSSALLLLLLGLMASRRKRAKDSELESTGSDDGQPDGSSDFDKSLTNTLAIPLPEQPDENQVSDKNHVVESKRDVLAEVDTCIAYGRFGQAVELLQEALKDEPERSDLRLKFMEVHAERGDREGFAREEARLQKAGKAESEIANLKSRFPAMAVVGAGAAAGAYEFGESMLDEPHLEQELIKQGPDEQIPPDTGNSAMRADTADIARASASEATPSGEFKLLGQELLLDRNPDNVTQSVQIAIDKDDSPLDFELQDQLADFDLDTGIDPAAVLVPAGENKLDGTADKPDVEAVPNDEALKSLSFDFDLSETSDESTPTFELPDDFDLSLDDEVAVQESSSNVLAARLDQVDSELGAFRRTLDQQQETATGPDSEAESIAASAMMADLDGNFDFLADTDETSTKLDLAKAYIEMGDADGAKDILDEIVAEGNENQQQEAREMLATLA
ncbi:FimV/HubP family polar landmark protein [Azomonas macrocytogenes]|nr:FimV/HubP family polar landmark protein [Azomonas macrocytogenes]